MAEANLEIVSSPVVLVGDVHGQFFDVQKLLSLGTPPFTKLESHLKRDIYLLETSLIGDTTHLKQFCFYFAWRFSTLKTYIYWEGIISLGTIVLTKANFMHLWLSRRDYPKVWKF